MLAHRQVFVEQLGGRAPARLHHRPRRGEDRIEGGADTGFSPTVEAARARIESLKADSAWTKRYLGGDEAAKAEFQRLMRAAYPEG